MAHLPTITLTGADNSTQHSDLFRMLNEAAEHGQLGHVEFGVLWSDSQAGQGRYPDKRWVASLAEAIARAPEAERGFALHVCGRAALAEFFDPTSELSQIAFAFQRVQLNLRRGPETAGQVTQACQQRPLQQIITQHNRSNEQLVDEIANCPNHAILFDASGGRGKSPSSWPNAFPGVHCGFAGGLGPHNLAHELPRIKRAAKGAHFWVDMESSLRDSKDRFDLQQAQACIEIARSQFLSHDG